MGSCCSSTVVDWSEYYDVWKVQIKQLLDKKVSSITIYKMNPCPSFYDPHFPEICENFKTVLENACDEHPTAFVTFINLSLPAEYLIGYKKQTE